MRGLSDVASETKQNLVVQGLGPMFVTYFGDHTICRDYRDTLRNDKGKLSRFIAELHDRGIRVIGRGLWYISAAHTESDINHTIETAAEVLRSWR